MISSFSFRELEFAADRHSNLGAQLRGRLDQSLRDPGAFRLTDVPDPEGLLKAMEATTRHFFELPADTKAHFSHPTDPYLGWCGDSYLRERGSRDHKEMFHIGPRIAATLAPHDLSGLLADQGHLSPALARDACVLWPDQPDDFVQVWHDYYRRMQSVAAVLGRVLAAILDIDESEWFAIFAENWADLAANFYPAIDATLASGTTYNAAHSDIDAFTILHQDDSAIGTLSIQAKDESWQRVVPVPETYLVNAGQMLTYLSGERFRAAPHRVTAEQSSTGTSTPRMSIPFFYRPRDDVSIQPLVESDHPPMSVGAWVHEQRLANLTAG